MKVVHREEDSVNTLLQLGKEAEAAENWAAADKIYHRILQKQGSHLQAFQRLMIIYRKQKAYAKELSIINKAITAYNKLYEPKSSHNKSVQRLSARINKAFGMTDRRGHSMYEPGPVAAWKKRKSVVEKRLAG